MYDIKPLEEDWKKYKLKKRKPLYLFMFIFLIVAVFLYYLLNSSEHKINVLDKFHQNINHFSKNNAEKYSESIIPSILVNGGLNKLEVLDEVNIVESLNKDISEGELLVDIPILDVSSPSSENKVASKKGRMHLDIFETTSITAYEDVENRFKQTADIDDALFLAKSYYKKDNFKKSEYWAFEANKLDSTLEESFLIFVKSKFKLGKINEAISILNSYLKRTKSHEASALLEQLKNNKL